MKGRHFVSPIPVNHWQTSSVFSFPRNLASCLSMSWGDGAVTYLLLIPQLIWQSLLFNDFLYVRALYEQATCLRAQPTCRTLALVLMYFHHIFSIYRECARRVKNLRDCHEGGTWRTKMIHNQFVAWEKWVVTKTKGLLKSQALCHSRCHWFMPSKSAVRLFGMCFGS